MKVWDGFVRVAHWTLAASVLVAWITSEWKLDAARRVHEWAGYVALGVVALRCAWGLVGSRYARFAQFVASPARTLAYAASLLRGAEPRYIGHNPLGAWMIVALLATVTLASASGWLFITERFWGVDWVEDLHEALGNTVIVLVGLHVAGVMFTSLRERENLAAAMFTGRKRPPGPGDVA